MAILELDSGVLPSGITEVGLEFYDPLLWKAWCVSTSGFIRLFEFQGPNPQNWLACALMSGHGFEADHAVRAADWLFESVER